MKIYIEETNSSNIGGYKNTRNCEPIISQSMQRDKPIKGSYAKWHSRKTESAASSSFTSLLKSWNMTLEMLRELVYNWIIDHEGLEFAIDNDMLSAEELSDNESRIYEVVDELIPYIEKYCNDTKNDPRTFEDALHYYDDCKQKISSLTDEFEHIKEEQDSNWDNLVESIGEEI